MENNLQKLIGDRIRAKRKAAQLSQSQLAEQSNYSNSAISAFETGERSPSLIAAFSLADNLDCSVEDFRPRNAVTGKPWILNPDKGLARMYLSPEQEPFDY